MIVVDTNIIAYLYLSGERSRQAEELLSREPNWVAPILWRSEFRNILTHYLSKKLLNLDDIMLILQQAESLMADSEYEIASAQVMRLVNNSNCSAYDCEFVAIAQYLNVPLVTADKNILQEFPDIARPVDSFID
ncbi:MAG: PIN domain-containing protein [Deltaproteobacteria bacterium]|jgi:predicted nucleic acid-binding protein|nr:PIN domain-containing protein [Deltaproteobacteria bacterium]